jgi:hypothetical protein
VAPLSGTSQALTPPSRRPLLAPLVRNSVLEAFVRSNARTRTILLLVGSFSAVGILLGFMLTRESQPGRSDRPTAASSGSTGPTTSGAPTPTRGGPSLPRLTATAPRAPRASVQNDPLSADYDASKLADLKIPVHEIFRAEPRNAAWARPIEQSIRRTMDRDFEQVLPGAKVEEMECRTMTCRMVISAKDYPTLQQAVTLTQYTPLAPHSTFGGGGALSRTIYMAFTPGTLRLDDYESWYRRMREDALPRWRSGRSPTDPPVPNN